MRGRRPEGPEGETVPPGLPPIPVVAVPVWAVAVILNVANYISTDNDLQQTLTLIYENQGTDPGQCLLADRRDMPDEHFVHQIIEILISCAATAGIASLKNAFGTGAAASSRLLSFIKPPISIIGRKQGKRKIGGGL